MNKFKKILSLVLVGVLIFTFAACSKKSKNDTIVIYDGQFSEMQLVHRMVKILTEEHTNAKVDIKDEMAPPNSFNEMVSGNADLMNSYDGTLLTTFLHMDPADVPEGESIYDFVNKKASETKKVHLLDKLGTNNTYTIGVPEAIAKEYNLEKVSDLTAVADKLVFGAEHDFFTEEGSAKFNPFVEFYGLKFKESKQIDLSLKYSAIENGDIDVTVVYATDGLNRKAKLKILEDDKKFFPEYNGALLVRDDLFERMKESAPKLEEVLNSLGGLFTNEEMVDLTYKVDVEGENADDVAREFLKTKGLIQ